MASAEAGPQADKPDGLQTRRFATILVYGAWVALVAHALFGLFFLAIGVRVLALFNVGSMLLFVTAIGFARRTRLTPALLLATLEVISHAWLAVATLGWASGFHYYLFVLAPVAFFNPRWVVSTKLGYLAFVCLAYIGISVWSQTHAPVYPVDVVLLSVMHYFNIASLLGFLAYFAHYYAKAAHQTEDQLERLAATDVLTGLYNRRRLLEVAVQEQIRQRRSDGRLALVLADADGFKALNDRHGHECGDLVLQTIALRLRQSVRAQDHVARWGGEEFVLLLPQTDLAGAREAAEKVRLTVAGEPIDYRGENIRITLSAGVSEFRPEDSFAICLARADRALLEAKRAGRNRVVVAANPM